MPEFKATLHAVQGDYFSCVWLDLLMMLLICHCPWPRTRGTHAAQLHSTSHPAQHPLLQKWSWRENHCFCLSRESLPLLKFKFSKAYAELFFEMCVCVWGVMLFMFSNDLAVESKYDSGRGLYFSPFYLPSLLYWFWEIIWITAAEEVLWTCVEVPWWSCDGDTAVVMCRDVTVNTEWLKKYLPV